jgi:signal transduction histidine kinase
MGQPLRQLQEKFMFNPPRLASSRDVQVSKLSVCLVWLSALLLCGTSWRAAADELRTAAAVRSLSVDEAKAGRRVKLRGVVTFYEESLFSRFVQDETSGVYLYDSALPVHLTPGQLVEVVGTTSPGEYAPIVVPKEIKVVGESALPPAKQVTYEQLASGKEDSQFVEISGIVRLVEFDEKSQHHRIEIATGSGRLAVYARQIPVANKEELPDSTIRVRGVCASQFNRQRQLIAIRLMSPRPQDLVVEENAPADPFAVKESPIGSLLQFAPQGAYGRRVKVIGTVVYQIPGQAVFLQDGDRGVEVQTKRAERLAVGDRVEALGFVAQGEYTPVLNDSVFRKIGVSPAPAPVAVTPDSALKGKYDCLLIQVSGRLLDRATYGNEKYLILQNGDYTFNAHLGISGTADDFAELQNGSQLSVTGICRIDPGGWDAGDDWRAKSFKVQLRSIADVTVLLEPPWWTLRKVLWIAAGLGFVSLAAFVWVAVLQRKVAERTRDLEIQSQQRQRAERRREIEQERARVAHDLHDDLGARLTEVSMLSALVKSTSTSTEEKNKYLDQLSGTTRDMVTSLDEIVWAVNPRNDTIASLASYFGSYAQRLLDLASVSCGLDVTEDLPDHPIDPKFRQELFLAFKESLTNVVRHAKATKVWLRISVKDDSITVEVEDNGSGFDLRERAAGADGIVNMRDRLSAIGGVCEITSTPQKGTTVRFQVPLPEGLL